jgi:hypothetical protein
MKGVQGSGQNSDDKMVDWFQPQDTNDRLVRVRDGVSRPVDYILAKPSGMLAHDGPAHKIFLQPHWPYA